MTGVPLTAAAAGGVARDDVGVARADVGVVARADAEGVVARAEVGVVARAVAAGLGLAFFRAGDGSGSAVLDLACPRRCEVVPLVGVIPTTQMY